VAIGLNLIPFAGIAFLWFIGVIRDRIGAHEDRFFATVLLLFPAWILAVSIEILASGRGRSRTLRSPHRS
jgi:hypothetical protein